MLFKVIRPKDTVYVGLYRHKDTNEYSFVNLTKGHICPCKFSSVEEAIADMEKQKKRGSILSYVEIKQTLAGIFADSTVCQNVFE